MFMMINDRPYDGESIKKLMENIKNLPIEYNGRYLLFKKIIFIVFVQKIEEKWCLHSESSFEFMKLMLNKDFEKRASIS